MNGRRTRPQPSHALLVCVIVTALGGGGCESPPTVDDRRASIRAAGLTTASIADPDRLDRLTGLVLTGHGLRVTSDPSGAAAATRHYGLVRSPGATLDRGCATAVDVRGYYVTAAHVVGSDPVWVIVGGGQSPARAARVVYRGDADFDVAVLCVGRPIEGAFGWSTDDPPAAGSALIEVGPTDLTEAGQIGMQVFAGRFEAAERQAGVDGRYEVIDTSLPARPGDSGGPVLTPDGSLVAIMVRGHPFSSTTTALRPDPAWLKDVIDGDAAAVGERPAGVVPRSDRN